MKCVILIPIYNDRESLKLLIENINYEVKDLKSEGVLKSTGKSESYFRKCSDENDTDRLIHHIDSVKLDIECMKRGLGHPLLTAHQMQIERAIGENKDINVISLHTAQDVRNNVNADTLVELFNIKDVEVFANTHEDFGAGRIGTIDPISNIDFLKLVEKNLNTKIIRTNAYFDNIEVINKLAVLPGSETQFIDEIINEADVFLTGDISHRYFLLADDNGLGLVQVNHISTEIPGMSKFVDILANELNIKVKYFYNKNYG